MNSFVNGTFFIILVVAFSLCRGNGLNCNNPSTSINILEKLSIESSNEVTVINGNTGKNKAFHLMRDNDFEMPAEDVLPLPMPDRFLLTMIFRLSGKTAQERFELIRLDGFDSNDNEVSYFSVVLDGSKRSLSIESFDSEKMRVVNFADMQDAYKLFDKSWHRLQVALHEEQIEIFIDCKKQSSSSFSPPTLHLQDTYFRLGYVAEEKSVPLDIQSIMLHCEPEISRDGCTASGRTSLSSTIVSTTTTTTAAPQTPTKAAFEQAFQNGQCSITCPVGAPGPPGVDGSPGEEGSQGIKGSKGDMGEKGDPGNEGLKGIKGSRGDKGEIGEPGPPGSGVGNLAEKLSPSELRGLLKGLQGSSGNPGADGIPGRPGAPGNRGPQGEQGMNGETGPPGKDGKDGRSGDKGDRGEPGHSGRQGDPGSSGAKGPPGEKGNTGSPGLPGQMGMTGHPGKSGMPGSPGPQGPPGSSQSLKDSSENLNSTEGSSKLALLLGGKPGSPGPPGSPGQPGISALPGSPGPPGQSGARGATGAPGPPGRSGLPGPAGAQGPPGNDGNQGHRGIAGMPGDPGLPGRSVSTAELSELCYKVLEARLDDLVKDLRGPPGSPGVGRPGRPGPPGPQGIPGDRGPIGMQGERGLPGSPGYMDEEERSERPPASRRRGRPNKRREREK